MRKTVELAKRNCVVVGAHPGFPDIIGFGRRKMEISEDDAWCYTVYQVGALKAFLEVAGLELHHVKPHGALYWVLTKDEKLSKVICDAIVKIDSKLLVYWPSPLTEAFPRIATEMGLKVIGELNADTGYTPDGVVAPFREKHAIDLQGVRTRIRQFITEGTITAVNGEVIKKEAHSICTHGDTPNAIDVLKAVRDELKHANIAIAPFKKPSVKPKCTS
jgi:UPF0271 protein